MMHDTPEGQTQHDQKDASTEYHLNVGLAAQPRTALVTQFLELREKYIASGGKLYTADEINDEVRAIRG